METDERYPSFSYATVTTNVITPKKRPLKISKEIGLIYGVLMRRCHNLSRIQRVVTMAMAEENVRQKV